MEISVILILLLVCIIAFSLPFLVTGATAQKLYSSDLVIPNTGLGSATATQSTERAMTITAFANLFATGTPQITLTFTSTGTVTATFTSSPTLTLSPSATPTLTLTLLPIQPSQTDAPRQADTKVPTNQPPPQATRTSQPQPTNTPPVPTKTDPAPTNTPIREVTPPPPDPTNTPEPQPTEADPTAESESFPPTPQSP